MTNRTRMFLAASLLTLPALMAGCSQSEPAKAPPGVTKEMEQTAPPQIDMGAPSSKPNLPTAKDAPPK